MVCRVLPQHVTAFDPVIGDPFPRCVPRRYRQRCGCRSRGQRTAGVQGGPVQFAQQRHIALVLVPQTRI